jgi:hypothetical protein
MDVLIVVAIILIIVVTATPSLLRAYIADRESLLERTKFSEGILISK